MSLMPDFIPVNEPVFRGNERAYLNECIETGWVSSEGAFVARFEAEFAERVNRRHGVAVCNGSAALELAVSALGIGAGDEVILPAFTIISCAAAVVRAGATPVVVDSEPSTWNMDVSLVEEKITPRTKAIMVVHIYGLPVNLEPVLELAERYGLHVIEDAAEAHGQNYKGKPCGSFGVISTFSFYPNKHITTGEGGMVVTDDDTLAEACRSLRNLCFQSDRRFVHEELGWNFRMSNLQAAVGVAQLEQLDAFVARKRQMGARYGELLSGIAGLQIASPSTGYADNIYWVFGVVLRESVPFDAAEAIARLGRMGIGTRPFFWPLHEQPVLRKMGLFHQTKCPVAENIARRGFYLPSGLALTDHQQNVVVDSIHDLMR